MMEESKWAKFNTCIIGNQKHKKQKKKKVIHIHKQLQTCWLMCPSRSLFSELSIHFYVIKIIQLSCFFTHHEYLAKYQSYAILITKNTPLHQLHLEGSLLKSHVSSAPPKSFYPVEITITSRCEQQAARVGTRVMEGHIVAAIP